MSNNTQAYFGELSRSPSNEYDSPHSSSQLLDRKSPSIWKWKGFNCTIPHIPWWQYNLKLFHNKVKNYFIVLFFSRKGAKEVKTKSEAKKVFLILLSWPLFWFLGTVAEWKSSFLLSDVGCWNFSNYFQLSSWPNKTKASTLFLRIASKTNWSLFLFSF